MMRKLWRTLSDIFYDASRWCEDKSVRIDDWRLFSEPPRFRSSLDSPVPASIDPTVIPKSPGLKEDIVRGALRQRVIPEFQNGPWSGLQGNDGNQAVADLED